MTNNWLDSLVGFFSPVSALKRVQARNALSVARSYDASSRGRRTGGWNTFNSGSPNVDAGLSLGTIRSRSRDLVRNNPYATRAVAGIAANMVGTGILLQASSSSQKRKADLNSRWKAWADSTDCDADGLHNFAGLQNLAIRGVVESGEALVVRRWRKKSDGFNLPVPMQIQVLEGDYIDTTRNGPTDNGGYILQGIEFDSFGRRIAYWLWNQHPGELFLTFRNGLVSKRTPAEDVKHIYRVDRAGQVRGISWGAPCILRMHDFDGYEDAVAVRMKIAACFSAFVGDMETPDSLTDAKAALSDKLEPGAIEILPPGKSITFPNMPSVNDDGFSMRSLRAIAMGFGVTYEMLTGDLSNVNFSSGRMGWVEFNRNIDQWQWLMFIPRFCAPVWSWFLQAAELSGVKTDGTSVSYTPPRREMIDPTKEIPAKRDAVRNGFMSLSEAIREEGRNPEEVLQEMKDDADSLDKLGLILDCDPRKTALGGNAQTTQAPTDAGGANVQN